MVESLYLTLENVGFAHPLHPALTHAPMGMIIGMILFGILGVFWKGKNFSQTAYYCSVVALVAVIPTAFLGTLDWLHFYEGELLNLIKVKMALTVVLTSLLAISVVLKKIGTSPNILLAVYFLCLGCAGGLGFSGGELVFG